MLVVVYSLARVFDMHSKVRDIFLMIVFTVFNTKKALDWTSNKQPS
jgi:hypothetical protein